MQTLISDDLISTFIFKAAIAFLLFILLSGLLSFIFLGLISQFEQGFPFYP